MNKNYEKIVSLVCDTLVEAGSTFREDKKKAYKRVIASEDNERAKWVLETVLANAEAAEKNHSPLCDDTGIITKWTMIFLRSFRIRKYGLQNPLSPLVIFRCDYSFISFLLIFSESGACLYKRIANKRNYFLIILIHKCSSHVQPQ